MGKKSYSKFCAFEIYVPRDKSPIMFYLFEGVAELCSFNISVLFVALSLYSYLFYSKSIVGFGG